MQAEREKLLQRTMQFLTALCVLLTVFIIFYSVGGKPFASIFQDDSQNTPKKVKNIHANQQTPAGFTASIMGSEQSDLNPLSYARIGETAFQEKDFQKAQENFHLASNLEPKNADYLLGYIRALVKQRKIIEAQKAIQENPLDDPQINLYKGYVAVYLNDRKTAESVFTGLLSAHPDFAPKIEPFKKAYEEFDFTVDGKPEYLQALLAKAFDALGEYELAFGLALDATASRSDYRDAWIIAGHAALASGRFAEAEQALQKALALDSQSPEATLYLAYAEQYLEKYSESAKLFESAKKFGVRIDPNTQAALLALAEESGNDVQTLALQESILSARKESARPADYVHAVYLAIEKVKDPGRALALAQKAYSYFPDDPMSVNLLGWSSLASGDFENAKKYLDRALALDPKFEAAYYNYGKLFEALGETARAIGAFKKSIALSVEHGNTGIEKAATSHLQSLTPFP